MKLLEETRTRLTVPSRTLADTADNLVTKFAQATDVKQETTLGDIVVIAHRLEGLVTQIENVRAELLALTIKEL